MSRVRAAAFALSAAWCLASSSAAADATNWATAGAADLARQADADVARGETATATRLYLEAIRFDGTYAPAYLALGKLYESTGELREAERTYGLGIERVAGFAEARIARARLFASEHRMSESVGDLEVASAEHPDNLALLRELARGYVSANALPAALATARRFARLAEAGGDSAARSEARAMARALAALVGEADAVTAGRNGTPVRRALAALTRSWR